MPNFISPFDFIRPYLGPPTPELERGLGQGMQMAQFGAKLPLLRAQTAMQEAQVPYAAKQARIDAETKGMQYESLKRMHSLLGGEPEGMAPQGTAGTKSALDLIRDPAFRLSAALSGTKLPDMEPTRQFVEGQGFAELPKYGGEPVLRLIPGLKQKTTSKEVSIGPNQTMLIEETPLGGRRPIMQSELGIPGVGDPRELPEDRPITGQKFRPTAPINTEPYKVGHVQAFQEPDGTTIYREYLGNGKWGDRPDLGGKIAPKGFDTEEEAWMVARDMVKKAGPDAALTPMVEQQPGGKWSAKPVPNISLRIPPATSTPTPGVGFDRVKKQWFETLPDGTQRTLSSQEVRQKRLEFLEDTPVNDIKTMQQSVPSVLQLIKQARANMVAASTSLGPVAGRWSEFYSGKAGASNPEFRRLMVDVGLLKTRLMKMHVGARGGVEMLKHFSNYFDAAKDSPDNLKAAFDAVEEYANEVGLPLAEQKRGAAGAKYKNLSDEELLKKLEAK